MRGRCGYVRNVGGEGDNRGQEMGVEEEEASVAAVSEDGVPDADAKVQQELAGRKGLLDAGDNTGFGDGFRRGGLDGTDLTRR